MSTNTHPIPHPARTPLRRGISICLAFLLAVFTVAGASQAAHAATPGINATILLGGATYNGTQVVNEGDMLKLIVQYSNQVEPGSTVTFELGPNVTLVGVPSANSAIESVNHSGNTVAITFRDPWPSDVNQGVFDLDFVVDDVDASGPAPIVWRIDGEESSVDVIVRNSGDEFANVSDNSAKGVSPGNLDSMVSVSNGVVVVNPDIVNRDLTYTLRLDSPTARAASISDQLPAGMAYVAGSFAGRLTTWDADGLNRTTGDFAFSPTVTGNSFAGTANVPGPSQLAVTYTARVTDTTALQAELQAAYDARGGTPGNFETFLVNTATFEGTDRTAQVRLRGSIAGVGVGQAFGKSSSWNSRNVETDESGAITPPADITYTLRAELSRWDGRDANFTLTRNVVISDSLPSQATWNTAAADFITADGIALTAAGTCPDAAAFAGNAYVGQYCVSGQTLMVNVGQGDANVSVHAKALVTTIAGLEQGGDTSIADATPYRLPNAADFDYREGAPYRANHPVTVVQLPELGGGINDSSVFRKSGSDDVTVVDPGETATMTYTFRLAAGSGIDVRDSYIVDYVDTEHFDVSDLSTIAITGSYGGQALGEPHFDLSLDADGNLVVELSPAGVAVVDAAGDDLEYIVTLPLTTVPFDGKETMVITNRASLFGSDGTPRYWSAVEGEATSYGDEAEVRKRVLDRTSEEWVETLLARYGVDGSLVQDTYVYRIEFIPRGSYDNVVIVPVNDVLPDSVEFLGFVDESDALDVENPTNGPVDIGGNLVAVYDDATGTVTLQNESGTRLEAGEPIAAYVAVRVIDDSEPIVNSIGSTSAEIVPLKSVSVGDYVWVDTNRDGRQDEGEPGIPGVVLTIVGPDGEEVTDINGNVVGPVTTGPNGEYTFENLPALEGEQTYTVRIDREASEEALRPYVPTVPGAGDRGGDSSTWEASTEPGDLYENGDRDPTLDFGFVAKTYAIGDVVWIDANKNGVQDPDEAPLAGVTVELIEDGEVIATTTTDAAGRYVFDNLPAGTYQVKFTLTEEQQEIYEFTSRDSGSDDGTDSDANPADGFTVTIVLDDSNEALTGDYEYREISATQGIDPTWDAGVVLKEVPTTPPPTEEPTDKPTDKPKDGSPTDKKSTRGLAQTGANLAAGVLATIALLGIGSALAVVGRHTRGGRKGGAAS